MEKECKSCHETKSVAEFYRHGTRWYRSECKKCYNKLSQSFTRGRPAETATIQQRHKLKKLYGVTPEDIAFMLKKQDGKCAICCTDKFKGKGTKLHIDHDHSTGKVRGLLCMFCNTSLGKFRDDVSILKRAIVYLEGV